MKIACPNCGAQYDASVALADEDARIFFGLVAQLPPAIVRPLVRYLGLFKPEKTRLRWGRMVTITKELAPMIKAARIQRRGTSYVVPIEMWATAMDSLIDTPSKGLVLPLRGNGYLLEMIAGTCEKAAAKQESATIEKAKHRDAPTTTQPPAVTAALAGIDQAADERLARRIANLDKSNEANP